MELESLIKILLLNLCRKSPIVIRPKSGVGRRNCLIAAAYGRMTVHRIVESYREQGEPVERSRLTFDCSGNA